MVKGAKLSQDSQSKHLNFLSLLVTNHWLKSLCTLGARLSVGTSTQIGCLSNMQLKFYEVSLFTHLGPKERLAELSFLCKKANTE